ncbi:DNA -binding domain-containing protein [Komagataeibacter sp. SM21]|uniref:DNA -binding domain-containing protein n=1 Tax=Komagataeibacter sp. SM21 TaxID=3242899 RepID=UPI0035299D54
MGLTLFDQADQLGRAIVVATPSTTFSLSLHGAAAACPAVHIPVDPSYRRRSDEAARFCAHVLGYHLPARHPRRITPTRWRQLALRLHAFDLDAAGASLRDIASELLDPDARTLADDMWRDSALRTMARALRDEGSALVHGGYLSLLDGL